MKVLAIDQGSNCGWALTKEIYGLWDLSTRKDESMGMKLLRFRSKLDEIHKHENLDLIVYERVAGFHKSSIVHAAKLISIIEMFCEEHGIDYRAYSAKEIKKFATGKGNAQKQDMIMAAKEKLGYCGDNDNEADALWMLTLANKELGLINELIKGS